MRWYVFVIITGVWQQVPENRYDKHNGSLINPFTLTTLNYFCIKHGDQMFFLFEIIKDVLFSSFRFI